MALLGTTGAFVPTTRTRVGISSHSRLFMAEEDGDDDELVARRIIVTGDVQGGYYRSCVLNEVSRVLVGLDFGARRM